MTQGGTKPQSKNYLNTASQAACQHQESEKVCPFSEVAQPRVQACAAFNKGQCVDGTALQANLQVCRYCLHTVNRLYQHTELFCKTKGIQKTGAGEGGLRQTSPKHNGLEVVKDREKCSGIITSAPHSLSITIMDSVMMLLFELLWDLYFLF